MRKKNKVRIDINPLDLLTEEKCSEMLREIRWRNGLKCPYCNSLNVRKRGKYGDYYKYECLDCQRIFNDKTNTVFYKSHLPIRYWCAAIIYYELGYSILKISRLLDISYDSAYRLIQKIKNSKNEEMEELKEKVREIIDPIMIHLKEEETQEETIDVSDVEVPREALNFMLELIKTDMEERKNRRN